MNKLQARPIIRAMTLNEMRDCIEAAREMMEFLAEKESRAAMKWLEKWGFSDEQ